MNVLAVKVPARQMGPPPSGTDFLNIFVSEIDPTIAVVLVITDYVYNSGHHRDTTAAVVNSDGDNALVSLAFEDITKLAVSNISVEPLTAGAAEDFPQEQS